MIIYELERGIYVKKEKKRTEKKRERKENEKEKKIRFRLKLISSINSIKNRPA